MERTEKRKDTAAADDRPCTPTKSNGSRLWISLSHAAARTRRRSHRDKVAESVARYYVKSFE